MLGSTRWLVLATVLSAVAVTAQSDCPSDPQLDPSQDPCNPLRYIPNKAANIVAAVLYFIVASLLTFRAFQKKANYVLCLVIGAWCEGIGLILRIPLRSNPDGAGIYIVMQLFVVLSPCAFLAANYILLGRMVEWLEAPQYIRPFKPRLVSRYFIMSDIVTFIIQAIGGSVSTSTNVTTAEDGGHIFLAGIVAQLASFTVFCALWASFAYRVRFQDQILWSREGWKPVHLALGISSVFFLIRSAYRTAELSQGYVGFLETHEPYFLALDTLPLFLGITTYVWFWPGKYIPPRIRVKKDKKSKKDKKAKKGSEPSSALSSDPEVDVEAGEGINDNVMRQIQPQQPTPTTRA